MSRCDTYAFGNCTQGACLLAGWCPEGLGDGGDWAANAARRGYQVTMTPTVGSIVSYCRGDGYSPFGHVGLVLAVYGNGTFQVREMNFVAFDQYDTRVSTMADVCGFILAPGMAPGAGGGLGGPAPDNPVWQVAKAWDNLRWYWGTGSGLSLQHLQDLTRWFDSVA